MVSLQINKAKYTVPSQLDELSIRQFINCVGYLFLPEKTESKAGVFLAILPPAARKKLRLLDDAQRSELVAATTSWLAKNHHACPLKSFRLGLTRYYLPRYERMSVIEAAKAQDILTRWQKNRNEDLLNLVVATLCRPRRLWIRLAPAARQYSTNWDGDEREKYNAEIVANRVKTISRLPLAYKLAVLWHFNSMMATAKQQFASVFAHKTPGSEAAPLIDMVFHLSGSELGDYKAVSHTPLTTVLYLIHSRIASATKE